MNSKYSKGFVIASGIFGLMFLFRLAYGYVSYDQDQTRALVFENQMDSRAMSKVNIASKKIKYQTNTGATKSIDQKYEKIATIESRSSNLEADEVKVRDLVKTTGSVIQYENSSGLKAKRNRIIKLTVGVPPEKFDDVVSEFKTIGKTILLTIDKRDKTNEYKDLQTKKNTLLSIRSSLVALKNRGGRIEEFIQLENRILEIEKEIQKLGINLGEFDSENEFCTVLLTIYESKMQGIPFVHRIKTALEWTIKYYFLLSFSVLFVVLILYFGLPVFDKIKSKLEKLYK